MHGSNVDSPQDLYCESDSTSSDTGDFHPSFASSPDHSPKVLISKVTESDSSDGDCNPSFNSSPYGSPKALISKVATTKPNRRCCLRMWAGGQYANETSESAGGQHANEKGESAGGQEHANGKGESVLLLEPQWTHTPSNSKKKDPCASFIGGAPCFFPNDTNVQGQPKCGVCRQEMYLILQMYAPVGSLERTVYIFGCNKASCLSSAFSVEPNQKCDSSMGDNRFCLGGHGVIRCIRSQPQPQTSMLKNGNFALKTYEEVQDHSFAKYELDVYDEPPVKNGLSAAADDDSDDEDVLVDDKNDAAVQKLLSKYLEEEDDIDNFSPIKGGNTLSESSGEGIENGEQYERLPPEDRAFWAFTNRVKRAPKQSVRYAYGGIPLWSM